MSKVLGYKKELTLKNRNFKKIFNLGYIDSNVWQHRKWRIDREIQNSIGY